MKIEKDMRKEQWENNDPISLRVQELSYKKNKSREGRK